MVEQWEAGLPERRKRTKRGVQREREMSMVKERQKDHGVEKKRKYLRKSTCRR